ncbi:MAG: hypothetical protein LZF86_50050 [Nitrospira sp.]|nr:MAG: hypothetical protein LZF86_50050 [Nitrospira sp.]
MSYSSEQRPGVTRPTPPASQPPTKNRPSRKIATFVGTQRSAKTLLHRLCSPIADTIHKEAAPTDCPKVATKSRPTRNKRGLRL